MATYAIGDIQGCYFSLLALLEKINFDARHDTLWFCGDLINRGRYSLETLRFIKGLDHSAISILGNHDMHLLAVHYGAASHKSYDTIDDILAAPDRDELCEWLRHQPLLHYDKKLNFVMTHAGLHPQWDLATAQQCAHELEAALRSEYHLEFFRHMYGNQPAQWDPHLHGWERLRFITNVLTRMRLVSHSGHLDLRKKGAPDMASENYEPWFMIPNRLHKDVNIVFGHWAALECNTANAKGVYAIDSGCVWGNKLTALRLEDQKRFSVKNAEK